MPDKAEPMSPFANFLYSFGAARKLLERAHRSDSLIEGMALYVSLIDACLRIALVLDKQLDGDEVADIDSYIQQVRAGPKFTEKMIYEEARRRNLIDDAMKDEIVALYEKRNAIIHRFFLTDMTYVSLGPLLDRYEEIYHHCYALVEDLETRQLSERKGMTRQAAVAADRQKINDVVNKKLGFDPGLG